MCITIGKSKNNTFYNISSVNFKKNEKVYNSAGSEVLKALQEAEKDPIPEPGITWKSINIVDLSLKAEN